MSTALASIYYITLINLNNNLTYLTLYNDLPYLTVFIILFTILWLVTTSRQIIMPTSQLFELL